MPLSTLQYLYIKQLTVSLLTIILTIILPPVPVYLKHGLGTTFLINVILTIVGWLPGVIHAFIVND